MAVGLHSKPPPALSCSYLCMDQPLMIMMMVCHTYLALRTYVNFWYCNGRLGEKGRVISIGILVYSIRRCLDTYKEVNNIPSCGRCATILFVIDPVLIFYVKSLLLRDFTNTASSQKRVIHHILQISSPVVGWRFRLI